MPLKTVAEQWMEQEAEAKKRKSKDEKKSDDRKQPSGVNAPVLIIGIAMLIFALTLFLSQSSGASLIPVSGNSQQRMADLQYQQQQLANSMTQAAERSIAETSGAQVAAQETAQFRQDTIATQAANTAWSMTQPALEATQVKQQLEIQKMQEEARLNYAILPFKVYFWPVVGAIGVVCLLILGLIALALVIPALAEKTKNWARVIKEQRGERTIIHNPDGETVRPDLQTEPVLRHKEKEPITTGGGFEDPQLQAGVVSGANYTKAIQGYPEHAKLPGTRPPEKALPKIEILDGKADQRLLTDTRNAVDGEEV